MRRVILLTLLATGMATAEDQSKLSLTISYFTTGDSNHGTVLAAFQDEPSCSALEVNVERKGKRTDVDPAHETWWLIPSPKDFSGYKKYRYNYVLSPPGSTKPDDTVLLISHQTARALVERICTQVTGTQSGARIHEK